MKGVHTAQKMTDRSGPACRIFIWAGKGKTGIRRQPYFRQAGDVAVSLAKKRGLG